MPCPEFAADCSFLSVVENIVPLPQAAYTLNVGGKKCEISSNWFKLLLPARYWFLSLWHAFYIFYLSLIFKCLTIMHLGMDFLGFILFGVAQILDLYVVSFTKLGALSSITSSNRFSAPLFPLCLGTLMI